MNKDRDPIEPPDKEGSKCPPQTNVDPAEPTEDQPAGEPTTPSDF